MPDAWVLVHDVLDDLRMRRITWEKAVSEIEKKAKLAQDGDISLFEGLRYGYSSNGDEEVLAVLLEEAVERMRKIGGAR